MPSGRFVNPFTDLGFKIIFGQPASKELLITLLNELLAGEHHIENLTFLDKEDHSDNVNDAGIIYDLYCLTSTGEYIIVEMQNRYHSHFLDRTLFYMCRAIGRQVENVRERCEKRQELDPRSANGGDGVMGEPAVSYGERYHLAPVYGVFLMNFTEPGLERKFRTDTVIADRDSGKVLNSHFRQIYLQFPFFNKPLSDCVTLYDKLIYTLKNMHAVANLSEENRIAYDKALDRFRVNRIVEEDIREAALEEGRKQGLEQGLEQGVRQGLKQAKMELALQMKRDGVSQDMICRYTGLSAGEVDAL